MNHYPSAEMCQTRYNGTIRHERNSQTKQIIRLRVHELSNFGFLFNLTVFNLACFDFGFIFEIEEKKTKQLNLKLEVDM